MALSTEQLCYINNLLYSTNPSIYSSGTQMSYPERTIGDLVKMIDPAANACATCSEAEWTRMKEAILKDEQLCNIQIKDSFWDPGTKGAPGTDDAGCMLVDPSTNEAIIAFRGTGKGEWKDNFIAGTTMNDGRADPTISDQQQAALNYADKFDLSGYDTVTVTGHSKGGNEAKLIALMNDDVDRCVSFDGQGFSDEFMEAHADAIAANQHKIQNHNLDGDFVNILLNDVGETTYYEGQRVGDNFAKNHDPSSFFSNGGEMIVGEQSEGMQALDYFLNSAVRSVDGQQRADVLDFAGELASAALGWDASGDKVWEVLMDPRYTEEVSYVLAYAIQYEHETGRISTGLADVLRDMGLEKFNVLVAAANIAFDNDQLNAVLSYAAQYADDIPDWVISLARKGLNMAGNDITDDEIRQLLKIIAKTGEKMGDIVIDKNAGADIEIPSEPAIIPVSPINGGLIPVDPNPFDFSSDSSGMTIFVHFAELMECCEDLRRAIEYYNEAVAIAKDAANELAENWVGEARDAFVEDQQNAFRWYASLSELASSVVQAIRQNHDRYSDTVDRLADIMRS